MDWGLPGAWAASAAQPPAAEAHDDLFMQHRIELPDGRQVLCAEYGRRTAQPILYFHGFMGSRLEPLAAGAISGNIIAIDRPGYGGTSPLPEMSLRRFAADLPFILDRLGIDRCGLIGASAGGCYALAAAASLGARVTQLVLVCAVADRRSVKRHGGAARLLVTAYRSLPLIRLLAPRFVRSLRRRGFDRRFVGYVLRREIPLVVDPLIRSRVADRLTASFREAIRGGIDGIVTDIILLSRDWDIDLSAVRVPTLILGGRADIVVPLGHAAWHRDRLPDASLAVIDDEGHISLGINQIARILDRFDGGYDRAAADLDPHLVVNQNGASGPSPDDAADLVR